MKKIISLAAPVHLFAAFFMIAFSGKSAAQTVLKYCNNCISDYSFQSQAKGVADFDSSKVIIMNSMTGEVKKYNVEFMPPEPGSDWESGFYVSETSLSNFEIRTTDKIFRKLGEIRGYISADRYVPADVLPSAYSLIGRTYNQSTLSRFYNQTQTIGSAYSSYVGLVAAIAGKAVNVNVVVSLKFSDGSIALLKIVGADANYQLVFELVEIRDKNGDLIGIDYKSMHSLKNNVYSFDTNSLQKYLNAAALFGINTVNLRYAPTLTGTIKDIDCKTKQGKAVCEKVK